ncbi:MAG: biopolymer transporter ExbD [Candidatus Saccharibacteria bacterium]|nr:biopolymer transporter ExbD [Pseudorhodobacter sp.]
MKLRRPARPAERETVVALIDVTFFLLIFFMLVGRLDATAPFVLTPPVGTTGKDLPAGGITLSVAADGALALDGTPLTHDALARLLTERLARNPMTLIRINADKASELRHILSLITEFEDLGAKDVALIVTPDAP